jgi:hypothetical protein
MRVVSFQDEISSAVKGGFVKIRFQFVYADYIATSTNFYHQKSGGRLTQSSSLSKPC